MTHRHRIRRLLARVLRALVAGSLVAVASCGGLADQVRRDTSLVLSRCSREAVVCAARCAARTLTEEACREASARGYAGGPDCPPPATQPTARR